MRLLLLALLGGAGCTTVFDLEPIGEVEPRQGTFERTLTITQPTASELVEFPLSVVIDSDPMLASHVLDGRDIGFTAGGVALPCEVVRYDAATGSLDAWVRVPVLPARPDASEIELVYGAARSPCNPTEMWSAPYVAVFHGDLDSDRMRDSTSHAHDVAPELASAMPIVGPGIIGSGLVYDGVDDALCEQIDADGSLSFGLGSLTYSIWVNVAETIGAYDTPLYKGGASAGNPGYSMALGASAWNAELHDGLQGLAVELLPAPDLGVWHHLVVVVDREAGQSITYVDGISRDVESIAGVGSFSTTAELCVGQDYNPFAGTLDEARIHGGTRSAAWIEVEHANAVRRSDLIVVGPERSR